VAIAVAMALALAGTVWRVAADVPGAPAVGPLLRSVVLATAGALVAGLTGRVAAAAIPWHPGGSLRALGETGVVGMIGAAVGGAVFVPIAVAGAPPLRRLLRARWPFGRPVSDGGTAP
jgi:hypothetical protein